MEEHLEASSYDTYLIFINKISINTFEYKYLLRQSSSEVERIIVFGCFGCSTAGLQSTC